MAVGRRIPTDRVGIVIRPWQPSDPTLLAKQPGFSLHAATVWEARHRDMLALPLHLPARFAFSRCRKRGNIRAVITQSQVTVRAGRTCLSKGMNPKVNIRGSRTARGTVKRSVKRRLVALALAGLALRILVPAGLMPAEVSGGWYLALCPDGLPVPVATALLGHAHHHHHTEDSSDTVFAQCELGAGLSLAALDTLPEGMSPLSAAALQAPHPPLVSTILTAPPLFHSRAPPTRLPA